MKDCWNCGGFAPCDACPEEGTKEYQLGLEYVDSVRAYCVASGDEETAKTLVRLACTMARAEVNTGVELSERYFHAYVTEGTVLNNFHYSAWWVIQEVTDALDCVDLLGMSQWDAWELLQDAMYGLGPAKAAMALALMGFPMGCVDRHMMAAHLGIPALVTNAEGRQVANPELEQAYKRMVTRKTYPALHDTFFPEGNGRDLQWDAFWHLQDQDTKGTPGADFRRSSHMPYFSVVVDLVEGFTPQEGL